MTFWLGKPGTVLTALPHPGKGIEAPAERPTRVRRTVSGGQTIAVAPLARRTYTMSWQSLNAEQRSTIEAFHLGAMGDGPWALLDPWRRNHLTVNQSSATSRGDTTGFTPSTGETVASSTALVYRGPRALQWTATPSTAGILTLDPPHTAGWPTPALATWTLSGRVRGGGTDPIVTIGWALVWLDTAGSTVSTSTGATVATAAGTWAQPSVTAAAPAGAVTFRAQLRITAASITTSTTVTLDTPMLDMAPTVRTWTVGSGVPLVTVDTSTTGYRKPNRSTGDLVLVEVG